MGGDRVYRWKLAIQEFHPTYKYIKGDFNSTADTFSCLNRMDDYQEKDIEAMIEDSFLFYPTVSDINFPSSFLKIAEAQQEDQDFLQAIAEDQNSPKHYYSEEIHGIDIVYYKPSSEAVPKIYLPESLHDKTIACYHEFLSHPGITCLSGIIKANFYCSNFRINERTVRTYTPIVCPSPYPALWKRDLERAVYKFTTKYR